MCSVETFEPENEVNARILRKFRYTYCKDDANPTKVWEFLERGLGRETFYEYSMLSTGQYGEMYVKTRLTDPDEILDEIVEYLDDAQVDYQYWRNEPDPEPEDVLTESSSLQPAPESSSLRPAPESSSLRPAPELSSHPPVPEKDPYFTCRLCTIHE